MTHTYSIFDFARLQHFFLAFYNQGKSADDATRIVSVSFKAGNYWPEEDDSQLEWTLVRENAIGVQFPTTYTNEELTQILQDMLG